MRRWLLSLLLVYTLLHPAYTPAQQTEPQPANLTATQKQAICKVMLSRSNKDSQHIDSGNRNFVDELDFYSVPLSDHPVILVARSDSTQGHNSAFWLFDLRSGVPNLIGSPADKLGGFWKGTILPHTNYGFHDFVLGWGGPAGVLSNTTFRYDGQKYRSIRTAKVEFVDK
jgi:hypothetical protein